MKLKYTTTLKEVKTGKLIQFDKGTELRYIKRIKNGHLLKFVNIAKLEYCNLECTEEQYRNMIQ